MENKIVAIQIAPDLKQAYEYNNYKQVGFTTNIDYICHKNGVPVYINAKLNKGEIREIMANAEYKEIKPGNYEAMVRQVINKNGKNEAGEPDASKDIVVLELDVKGQDNYVYMTFFMKGYSDMSMKISKEHIEKILEKFDVAVLDDLAGKEATLTVKVNDKGYTNMYLSPKKQFYNWNNMFKFDSKGQFECMVKRFYKTTKGNKVNFLVTANVNGEEITEYVCYDLDKEWAAQKVDRILARLGVTMEQVDTDLIDKKAKLSIERKTIDGKVYFNKNIVFDKAVKDHFWK